LSPIKETISDIFPPSSRKVSMSLKLQISTFQIVIANCV
jgi:hypothetical protein